MRLTRDIAALALAGGLGAALLTGCGPPSSGPPSSGSPAAAGTHEVTDSTGASVRVPTSVNRIADAWPAHNEIVHMLGAGDKIVATALKPSTTPWLYTVNPSLNKAQTAFTNSTVNLETLTAVRPDVLFVSDPSQFAAKTTEVGIPTLQLIFQSFDGLKKVVATTADVLGPAAQAQARRYDSYLDTKLAAVSAVTSKIPVAQRPSVLHVNSLNPLVVDGTNSIIDAWISTAGGRNAAQVPGNLRQVSTEQVARWNPDVIILGSDAGDAADTGAQTLDKLSADPFWGQLAAVRNHRAHTNPTGAFLWDRYGVEEALQIQWAAKTLHPERFTGLDMVAETRSFYSQFLHYQLTDDQARRILAAQKPS
jgi:iron complex transport system substrate-binding protein